MSLPHYPAYKPSSVEWLGEVPKHWATWKISHGFQIIGSGTTPPTDNQDWYDGDVCWVTTGELRETAIFDTEKKVSREAIQNFIALKIFPKGSLAIAMYGATIGRLGLFGVAASTNQACCVLSGEKSLSTKFMFYWLQAFRDQIILLASGGGQPNISQEKVRSLRVACPTIPEQQTIARFLDAQTAKLNTLVAMKRALIAKLKEKRSALIARTVTRGLPPAAAQAAGLEPHSAMKASGVEWLGKIPVHWEVKPLKYLFKSVGGGTPSKANAAYWDGDIPWISPKDMSTKKISDSEDHISADAVIESAVQMVAPGATLIVVRSGILRHTIPVAINLVEVTLNQDMKALVARGPVLNEYLAYYIQGLNRPLLENWTKSGCTVESVESDYMLNSLLPVPPKNEQQAITTYLDREAAHIDQLIAKVEAAIERLAEYRQALITAAVTGKIDVRNNAIIKESA